MAELTMENPLSPSPLAALHKAVNDLKDCVSKLKEEFEDFRIPINDDNQNLHRFCAKLEFLLQAGMKHKTNFLGVKKDYWNYMSECLSSNKSLNDGCKFVKSISELKTNVGRGRALLRFALMHQRLADTIQQCVINGKLTSEWFTPRSVWLQHHLSSDIVAALYDLNDLQFDLSPQGYDLDTSWPTFAKKQFGGGQYPGNWQPPSRSISIASLHSIPPLEFGSLHTPLATPDHHHSTLHEEETEQAENRTQDLQDVSYLEMDPEQLRKRVMELEDENHSIQRKSNDFEVTCEKLKNELSLKSEIWQEKEAFYRVKQEDADKTIGQLQEKLATAPQASTPSGGGGGGSDMETKIKLMTAEKRLEAFRIEVHSLQKEVESKVKVDDAKNALVAMQDKRIAQLKRENETLLQKVNIEKQLAANDSTAGMDTDSQKQIKVLVERLAAQENAFARLLSHNNELKAMLNSLEDKSRNIARVAKEKVCAYSAENGKLKTQVAQLKAFLEQIEGTQAEHKDKECSIQAQISEFRASQSQLGDSVVEVNAILAAKDAEVERYKARIVELGKALQAAGFHADESTPDDLIDALNESEFLSRQLQSGIESLKQKLGCPESQPKSTDSTDGASETKTETKPEVSAEIETKPQEGETESKAEPAAVIRSVPDVTPAHESDTKSKEQALSENRELVAMMEGIQKEEREIIRTLKEEIEEKRRALEELRQKKLESEKSKKEKEKQLQDARDQILEQMSAKRAEMTEIRKEVSGLKSSVRHALDDMGTVLGMDEEEEEAGEEEEEEEVDEGEEEVNMKQYLQAVTHYVKEVLEKYKEKTSAELETTQAQLVQLQNETKVQEAQLEQFQKRAKESECEQQQQQQQQQSSPAGAGDEEMERLQSEMEDLQLISNDLRIKYDKIKTENLELKTSSVEDKKQIAEAQSELEVLMNEVKAREGKIEELEVQCEKVFSARKEVEAQIRTVLEDLTSKSTEMIELNRELEETKKLLNEVVEASTKHEAERKATEEKLQTVSLEKCKSDEQVKEKSVLAEMYKAQIQRQKQSIETLTEDLEELKSAQNEFVTKVKDQDEQVVTLTEKVTLLQGGLDKEAKVSLSGLELQLEKAVESRKAVEAEKLAVDGELADTTRRLMELTQEHDDLKKELNMKIDSIRRELDRCINEKNQLAEDRDKLARSHHDSEQEIERLQETKNKLATKIDSLEAQCDQAMTHTTALKAEKEVLMKTLETMEKQNKDLMIERDEYGKKLNDIKTSLGDANAIQDEILQQLDAANKKISDQSEYQLQLESHVTVAKEETLEKVKEAEEAVEEMMKLKETLDDLEQAKLVMSENANKSYFELKERLGQCICENDALREELQRVMREKEDAFRRLKEENIAFSEQIEKLSAGTETLTDKIDTLGDQIEELEEEKKTLIKSIDEKDSSNAELLSTIEQLTADLAAGETGLNAKDAEIATKVSEMQEEMKKLENELERQRKEVECKSQEVTALEFQLSSQLIEHQTQVQSYEGQQEDVAALRARLEEQESLIETLELELKENNNQAEMEAERHRREVENMTEFVRKEEKKCKRLAEENRKKDEAFKNMMEKNTKDAAEMAKLHERRITELQGTLRQLEQDNELLKKKLIKLARDKDQLWQKTDELEYKQKVKLQERWMDSSRVHKCLACQADFSFMLRKHHCRLCGRIYCYDCANNWVMTAHSSKKERVCNPCMLEQSQLQGMSEGEDTDDEEENEMEQTVEIPQRKSLSWLSQRSDDTTAAGGGGGGEGDTEDDNNQHVVSVESTSRAAADTDTDLGSSAASLTQQQQQQQTRAEQKESSSPPASDPEPYDMITQEDVDETVSDPVPDPSMLSSTMFSDEDLQDNNIESEPELWIAAGNSYAVPVSIRKPGTTLKWEFTTYPKDINFSLTFLSDPSVAIEEELIASCKCNSHKKPIEGELSAHKVGVYTLMFDNKASRFTSKKLHYKLTVISPVSPEEEEEYLSTED